MTLYRYNTDATDSLKKKIRFFVILVVMAFLCLWMRIWYLQILKGESFKELSENNRVRVNSLSPFRGEFRDRNGELLVGVRPSFNLYITPEDAGDFEPTLDLLEERIEFDEESVRQGIKKARSFKNILIKADVAREEVAFVEENKMRLPGIKIQAEPLRSYRFGEMASHVFGYLGEISKGRLDKVEEGHYQMGDLIGKDGIESVFESRLRGKKGFKQVEVDVSGRELSVLKKLPPVGGDILTLTLDVRLQQKAEEALQGEPGEPFKGALVAVKVKTGEILAMVSRPSFDPNLFAAGISRKHWNELIHDKFHPLQNRTISGQYPPGSIHKIIVALAALEEKVIDTQSIIYCPGHFRLGKGRYRCWKKGGHGKVNLHDALVQSCDVYFYTLGYRLGVDKIAQYAEMLGMGKETGIALRGEKHGLVPTTTWKKKARGETWLPGETISASIGQGFNLVTPLQQAMLMSVIANKGIVLKPHLVKKIETPNGKLIKEFPPQVTSSTEFSPESIQAVLEALRGVVNEANGTGQRSRLQNIQVSGKTGTAQVVRMKSDDAEPEEEIPYQFRDHAWFSAFAPYDDPEIAIAVLVEHGGHGGATAAPIAQKVLKSYFNLYPVATRQTIPAPSSTQN